MQLHCCMITHDFLLVSYLSCTCLGLYLLWIYSVVSLLILLPCPRSAVSEPGSVAVRKLIALLDFCHTFYFSSLLVFCPPLTALQFTPFNPSSIHSSLHWLWCTLDLLQHACPLFPSSIMFCLLCPETVSTGHSSLCYLLCCPHSAPHYPVTHNSVSFFSLFCFSFHLFTFTYIACSSHWLSGPIRLFVYSCLLYSCLYLPWWMSLIKHHILRLTLETSLL